MQPRTNLFCTLPYQSGNLEKDRETFAKRLRKTEEREDVASHFGPDENGLFYLTLLGDNTVVNGCVYREGGETLLGLNLTVPYSEVTLYRALRTIMKR